MKNASQIFNGLSAKVFRPRKKIADAGMKWTHEQFNGVKIAGYILDLVEKGAYKAPWNSVL